MLGRLPLRVCSWNVQLGLRLGAILAALDELGRPDVLALPDASHSDGVEDSQREAEWVGPENEWGELVAPSLWALKPKRGS